MIVAAGVLCWRRIAGEPYILVIHRAAHDDYSFPKGKQDPGESVPETAIRELREESRIRAALGPYLDAVHYHVGGKPKVVHYWTSQISAEQVKDSAKHFSPNHEVDELLWLPFAEAQRLLTYDFDRELLTRLEGQLPTLDRPILTVGVLRHAKATSRVDWSKGEASRPLTSHGQSQSTHLTALLQCWGAFQQIVTSPWQRCLSTVQPYATACGTRVRRASELTETDYATDPEASEHLVTDVVSQGRSALFCTHRPVLPGVLSAVGALIDEPARALLLSHATLAPAELVIAQIAQTGDAEHPFELVTVATYAPFDEENES
ncbi:MULTISPECIES: NUDIX hydrolase [unclassified Pseudoclavibacter]|uniref:NUDIX hydrolase n=1 Tax=unclassified Pseudoclavibacter TaxID=2615177 RepID=UPI001301244F|nr:MULTISPECIES: NUDIX domain-containing protein [unclassified Pseudoclavibacter]KAB1647262.1 NUDIX domain-containing protein [Pseudoclavibacter sp. CFCC 14310]KAB1662745.1 NUDIX domain-containing protein [Pseudoclavibacter sp. CFCC 13611]